jgi:ribonuclease P protein component
VDASPEHARPRLRHSKSSRVVSRGDFQRVYGEGVRVRGAVLSLVMVANGLERSRLGLSIGKTIWKGAVQRNRVRRMFREAFRLEQHELPRGFDVIAIAARPKLEPELAATRAEFVALTRKGAARWRSTTPEERAAQRAASQAAREARKAAPKKGAARTGGRGGAKRDRSAGGGGAAP